MSNEQQTQTTDDPSGEGWRDVEVGEVLQPNDMMRTTTGLWLRTTMPGRLAPSALRYRRRIEPQPSPDNLLNEIQVLIDLLRGVQDWSGTRVGDAIDVIEAQLFRRKVGQKKCVSQQQNATCSTAFSAMSTRRGKRCNITQRSRGVSN